MDRTLVAKAKEYAIECHTNTNHLYDGKPYLIHLEMVRDFATIFIDLINPEDEDTVIAGAWVHDVIEDTRQTYNDVKKATNKHVAEIAYALTNEKGKTREERANDKYYQGIFDNILAHYVKICDRLANIKYSKSLQTRMFDVYKNEYENFKKKLYKEEYKDMFNYMEKLLND